MKKVIFYTLFVALTCWGHTPTIESEIEQLEKALEQYGQLDIPSIDANELKKLKGQFLKKLKSTHQTIDQITPKLDFPKWTKASYFKKVDLIVAKAFVASLNAGGVALRQGKKFSSVTLVDYPLFFKSVKRTFGRHQHVFHVDQSILIELINAYESEQSDQKLTAIFGRIEVNIKSIESAILSINCFDNTYPPKHGYQRATLSAIGDYDFFIKMQNPFKNGHRAISMEIESPIEGFKIRCLKVFKKGVTLFENPIAVCNFPPPYRYKAQLSLEDPLRPNQHQYAKVSVATDLNAVDRKLLNRCKGSDNVPRFALYWRLNYE